MRIALYYPWLYLKSGAERVIVKLLEHSRHDWTLFTGRYEPQSTYPELRQATIVEFDGLSVKRSVTQTAKNCLRLLRRKLPLQGYDALVVVGEGLGDLVVLRNRSLPAINICLTPLRIAFDEVYQREYTRGKGRFARLTVAAGASIFRVFDRIAWRRYRSVFCISEEVRRRAVRGRLPGAERAEVLHVGLGVVPSKAAEQFDKFFLLPGRIMWTKNVELSIEAFREFRRTNADFADFRLVIAGFVDVKSQPYLEKLRGLAGDDPIEFRVDPTDAELEELYGTCRAVLFTALNEDWGMVPLEGMSFGKPAIAVNRGGPLESVPHDEAGFLEEPEPRAFARRMAQLAGDLELARSMGRKGREHVKRFDWGRFASRVDEELDRVCGRAAVESKVGTQGDPLSTVGSSVSVSYEREGTRL